MTSKMFRSYSENINRTQLKSEQPSLPSPIYPFSCDLCNESWVTETDVELHRKLEHFDIIRDQMEISPHRFCTVCMRLQESSEELIKHIKSRHLYSSPLARRIEREIYICHHCYRIFFNKDMLQAHIMYSHMYSGDERKNKFFTCPKCKKLCRLNILWFHLQLHEIPSISGCEICLAHFPSVKELVEHLKKHPMCYKCETCNIVVNKQTLFDKHIDRHHKSKPKKIRTIGPLSKTVISRKALTNGVKYNIQNSTRGLTLPPNISVCILCREICEDILQVRTHLLRDHYLIESAKKSWRCSCGAEFFNQVLIKHHVFKMEGGHRILDDNEVVEQMLEAEIQMPTIQVEMDNSSGEWRVAKDYKASRCAQPPSETDADMGDSTYIQIEDLQDASVAEHYGLEETLTETDEGEIAIIYAEIDDDQLVTIDAVTDQEAIES